MNEPTSPPPPILSPYDETRNGQTVDRLKFCRPQEHFCFSLASLTRLHLSLTHDRITLSFLGETVTIEGRELHCLYEELLNQTIVQINEQGLADETVAPKNATTVRRIWLGRPGAAHAALPEEAAAETGNRTSPPPILSPYLETEKGSVVDQLKFCRPQEHFCFPLASLTRLHLSLNQDRITLSFLGETVTIDGRELHRLYEKLLKQTIVQINEQGLAYETLVAAENATTVRRIWLGRPGSAHAALPLAVEAEKRTKTKDKDPEIEDEDQEADVNV